MRCLKSSLHCSQEREEKTNDRFFWRMEKWEKWERWDRLDERQARPAQTHKQASHHEPVEVRRHLSSGVCPWVTTKSGVSTNNPDRIRRRIAGHSNTRRAARLRLQRWGLAHPHKTHPRSAVRLGQLDRAQWNRNRKKSLGWPCATGRDRGRRSK